MFNSMKPYVHFYIHEGERDGGGRERWRMERDEGMEREMERDGGWRERWRKEGEMEDGEKERWRMEYGKPSRQKPTRKLSVNTSTST